MQKNLNIFLLIGQSNMAGRGLLDAVPPLHYPNVRIFRNGRWRTAVEPLHTDKPHIAGIGLGMSFAVSLVEQKPDMLVGLLPCAVGGTPLERWMPGSDLFTNALAQTRLTLSDGILKGILWHQGEGDCTQKENAEGYGVRLSKMIEAFRAALDRPQLPFVAGELGDFLAKHGACRAFFREINAQMRSCSRQLPRVGLASASGLTDKGDNVHFDSASLREFGCRYALVYQQVSRPLGSRGRPQ